MSILNIILIVVVLVLVLLLVRAKRSTPYNEQIDKYYLKKKGDVAKVTKFPVPEYMEDYDFIYIEFSNKVYPHSSKIENKPSAKLVYGYYPYDGDTYY